MGDSGLYYPDRALLIQGSLHEAEGAILKKSAITPSLMNGQNARRIRGSPAIPTFLTKNISSDLPRSESDLYESNLYFFGGLFHLKT